MASFVQFVEPVLTYLDALNGLTFDDRLTILDQITEELSTDADRFLALYPVAHESFTFWYDYAFARTDAIYQFDFIVDARSFEMGIVRVVYVEATVLPTR